MEGMIINLYGRVQGVNFRYMIKSFCDDHRIKGFVMNKEDGSVFVDAQGERENLVKLINWIQTNPGLVHLSGVNYKWKKSGVNYKEFTISREGNYIADKAKSILNLGRSIAGKERLKVPVHVAIIPDGNRRWAKEKGLSGSLGHYKAGSYDNLEELFGQAKKMGIRFMSIWGFSTENWKRDKKEIDALFGIVGAGIKKFRKNASKNKIRFRHLGRKDRLPPVLREEIEKLEKETMNYDDFNVQLCLDYGGKDEIVRAVNKILEKRGELETIDEESFSRYLDSEGIPEVDFIIRTSGEQRTSGFMPYQSSYAELYFSDVYFPDFDSKELKRAIVEFSKRKRRFGGG
jgi:undecaprenyl diphosphate synthase